MRIGNRRGIAGIDDLIIIALIAFAFWKGPAIMDAAGNIFHGGSKNRQNSAHVAKVKEPIYVENKDTHELQLAGFKEIEIRDNNSVAEQPPETLWQKMMAVWLPIVGIAIFCIVFPASLVAKIKNAAFQKLSGDLDKITTQHDELSWDAKLIVKSVDEGVIAMNMAITAAKTTMDTAQTTLDQAGQMTDPIQRQAAITVAQNNLTIARAVWSALDKMKTDIMTSISRKQDVTTKRFVETVQNDLANIPK